MNLKKANQSSFFPKEIDYLYPKNSREKLKIPITTKA